MKNKKVLKTKGLFVIISRLKNYFYKLNRQLVYGRKSR